MDTSGQRNAEAMVREFLLFRGFTQTLRSFEVELAADSTQGYQVDKIMQIVFDSYIPRYEIEKLVDFMGLLRRTLMFPSDSYAQTAASKIETALRKFYLVNALQKGRVDRVLKFFEKYGDSLLHGGEDWQAWFALPYLKNPSLDPRFQVYFTKEWLETLIISFRNFLCQLLDGTRKPALLKLVSRRTNYKAVKQELAECREKCSFLESTLQCKEEEISRLRSALTIIQSDSQPESKSLTSDDRESGLAAETTSGPSDVITSDKFQGDRDVGTVEDAAWPSEDDFTEVTVASQESFSGHTSPITRCRYSPTGYNIASASVDGTVRIWTYDSSASTSRNATIYCGAEIMSLDWEHKSGRLLMLGTSERGIKAWNVDAKRVVCDLSTNAAFPRVLDIKCSPTEALFVTAESSIGTNSMDAGFGSLTVWNMRNLKAVNALPLGEDPPVIKSICFNHNGKMVAAAADDGVIRLFDMNGCLPITGWPAHDGSVNCVRFAPNQTSIFTMGSDGEVFEWSLHNQGQILQSYNANKFTAGDGLKLPRHEMALASDGNSLLLTSNLQYAPLFNFGGGKPNALRTPEHGGCITSVDFHPHLNAYITGSADHSIHVTHIG